jgi:hypothetical protein
VSTNLVLFEIKRYRPIMGQGSQKVKTANGKIAVAFEEVTN